MAEAFPHQACWIVGAPHTRPETLNPSKVLQEAATSVKDMLATFETLGNVRSPVSVKALAGLKSALREIHEEGSMSNSEVSSITTAMHRVRCAYTPHPRFWPQDTRHKPQDTRN